jgi:hypothetical protein
MQRWSEARGQATSEYVALVLLVATALALAAGLTSGGVAGHVLAGLQRGLCRVAGAACHAPPPPDADLAPCPTDRSTRSESLGVVVDVLSFGDDGELDTVRLSDGRVVVTLHRGRKAGVEVGAGLHVSLGGRVGAEARVGISASFGSGASWTMASVAEARRFVERYGAKATVGGHAVDDMRSVCSFLCGIAGWNPHAKLPQADETDVSAKLASWIKLPLPLGLPSIEATSSALLGVRTRRDDSVTWFFELDADAAAEILTGPSRARIGERDKAVLSFTVDAHHRPVELGVSTAMRSDGRVALAAGDAASLGVSAGEALVTELDATVDLHDPRLRSAAGAFVAALGHPLALGALKRRAGTLRARVAGNLVLDSRTYAVSSSDFELGAKVALGPGVGADYERSGEGMRLLSAETRLPGLPFLPRDDCRPA